MPFCPECGRETRTVDRYCPGCGRAIEFSTAPRVVGPDISSSELADPASFASAKHRTILIVAGGSLSLVIFAFGLLFSAVYLFSSGAVDAVRAHFEMLKSGESDLAWRNTSEAFRSATPLAEYRALVTSRPVLKEIVNVTVPDRQVENSFATLRVRLTTTTGAMHDVPVQARKESDGRWRVSALDFSALPELRPFSGEPTTTLGNSGDPNLPEPASNLPASSSRIDPAVQDAMSAAEAFYAWYLAKWEEPDIEPDWFEKSERLTPGFRQALDRIQGRGIRSGTNTDLDYDPVVGAPEVPYGGFRAVHGESGVAPGTVRVVMLAIGWDLTLDVLMRRDAATEDWRVDAIGDLNQDPSLLPPIEITPARRAEATLDAIFDLFGAGEPWQIYALATGGFQEAVSTEALAAFIERRPEWMDASSWRIREKEATPLMRVYSVDSSNSRGEAILVDEIGQNVWGLHRLTWAGEILGAELSPALRTVIGKVRMSHELDPDTGRITDENYVFDAAGADSIYLEIPVSNVYPGLTLDFTIPAIDSNRLLVEETQAAPENVSGTWVFHWQVPRKGKPWPVGNYELILSIPGGPMRTVLFGLR